MGSRRFSLAIERDKDEECGNKPVAAFLIDTSDANYKSTPCINDNTVPKQLKKTKSAPQINQALDLACRLQKDEDRMLAMMPKRRFSVCDLNTFDNELAYQKRHSSIGDIYSCSAPTNSGVPRSASGRGGFGRNHCRRNSVAIKFQNPKSIDNTIEAEEHMVNDLWRATER